jgi:hypothetical protein
MRFITSTFGISSRGKWLFSRREFRGGFGDWPPSLPPRIGAVNDVYGQKQETGTKFPAESHSLFLGWRGVKLGASPPVLRRVAMKVGAVNGVYGQKQGTGTKFPAESHSLFLGWRGVKFGASPPVLRCVAMNSSQMAICVLS